MSYCRELRLVLIIFYVGHIFNGMDYNLKTKGRKSFDKQRIFLKSENNGKLTFK